LKNKGTLKMFNDYPTCIQVWIKRICEKSASSAGSAGKISSCFCSRRFAQNAQKIRRDLCEIIQVNWIL